MQRKKIGLCIEYKNWNYGTILQSYATLIKMKNNDIPYEIIRYRPAKTPLFYIKALPRLLNQSMLDAKLLKLKKLIARKENKEFAENEDIRVRKFESFVKEKFDGFSPAMNDYQKLRRYSERFGAVVVGSDQLWVPAGLATNFYNLKFVPDHIPKISYATSFGVSQIPFYQKKRTADYLKRFSALSVREQSGQKIIEQLTGRKAQVMPDPTMMITREEWDEAISHRTILDKPYVFCYFLGKTQKHRHEALKLAKAKNLPIVTLRHLDEYVAEDEQFGDIALYDVGPGDFVNLIRGASYICTDSFHGSVFSILYHKQFLTFDRYAANSGNSRNTRIDNLMAQMKLDRRFSGNIINDMDRLIDYEQTDMLLKEKRQEGNTFLEKALASVRWNDESIR